MDAISESNAPAADREANNDVAASSIRAEENGVVQPRMEETNQRETNDAAVHKDQLERQRSLVGRSASNTTTGDATLPESACDSVDGLNEAPKVTNVSEVSVPAKPSSLLGKRQLSRYRRLMKYAGVDDSGNASVVSGRITSEGASNAMPEGARSNFDYGPVINRRIKQGAAQPGANQNEQTPKASANVTVASPPSATRLYQFRADHMAKVLKKFDLAACKFQQLSAFDAQTSIPTKIAGNLWLTEDELQQLFQFQEVLARSHERVKFASADVISRKIWAKAPQLPAREVWIISRYIRNLKPLLCCIHDVQLFMPTSEMADDNWLSALTEKWLVETFRGETTGLLKTSWLEKWIRHTSPTFHYLIGEFIERNLPLARVLAISDYPPKELERADVRIIGQLLCRIARYSQMTDHLPPVPFPLKPNPMRPDHPEIVFDSARVVDLTFPPAPAAIVPEGCPCGSDSSHELVENLPRFEDVPPLDEGCEFLSLAIGEDDGGDSRVLEEDPPADSPNEYQQAVARAIERVGNNISFAETKLFWEAVKQEMPATTVDIERLPKGLLAELDGMVDLRKFFPMECDQPQQVEPSAANNERPTRVAKTKANELIKQVAGCCPGHSSELDASAQKQERSGSPILEDPTMDPAGAYKIFQQNRNLMSKLLNQPGYADGATPRLSDPVPEMPPRQSPGKRVPIGKVGTFPSSQVRWRPDIPLIMLDDFCDMRTPSPTFSMTGCADMPDLSDILGVADSATGKEGSSDDSLNSRHRPYERRDGAGPSQEHQP